MRFNPTLFHRLTTRGIGILTPYTQSGWEASRPVSSSVSGRKFTPLGGLCYAAGFLERQPSRMRRKPVDAAAPIRLYERIRYQGCARSRRSGSAVFGVAAHQRESADLDLDSVRDVRCWRHP